MSHISPQPEQSDQSEIDSLTALNNLAASGSGFAIAKTTTGFENVAVSSGGGTWGSITGTLSDQTDLQAALDAKLATATATTAYVPYTGATGDVDLGANDLLVDEIETTYIYGGSSYARDTDTYIQFLNGDHIEIVVGGVEMLDFTEVSGQDTITFGNTTTNVIFNNQNLFINNAVGIQTGGVAEARLHIGGGTTTVAQIKLNSGTLLTTPVAGVIEFVTDVYYGTITTGAERKQFAFTSDLHSATTVLDGSTIDFTLTGQQITAEVITGAIDHDLLLNYSAARHIDWTNATDALLTTLKGEFGSGANYYADIGDNVSNYAGYFSEGSNVIVLQSAAEALKISNTGGTQTIFKKDGTGFVKTATFALAIGIAATVRTNKTNGIVVPRTGEIVKAFAYAKTGPTGAALIFDINLNGSTIWATQANRLQIAAGATSGTQTSFNTTAVTEADILTIDIDQIGSGTAGQDITVELLLRLRNQ